MDEQAYDVEKSKSAASDEDHKIEPAPEGGTRAWLVATGSTLLIFSTLGFTNSIGTIFQYYQANELKGVSSSQIAWIGSLSQFLQFFSGVFGGPLFDRFGAKVCSDPRV